MKTFQKVTVAVDGNSVDVNAREVENPGGVSAFQATATFGTATVTHTHSLAPVDGGHGPLHPQHVQNALDHARMKAARHAVLQDALNKQMAAAT